MASTTTAESTEEHPIRVLDPGALRALAHPLRVQIFDLLSQYGAQTASTLAAMTGESTGSTSYHLRALARHDLIREIDGRGTGRERWWERPIGSVSFANPEAMKTPSGRAATQLLMSEFFTRRHQQLMRFIAQSMEGEEEQWREAAMLSTATAQLTVEQLRELTTRIAELVTETVDRHRDQTGDVRRVTIRTDIFPIPEEGH